MADIKFVDAKGPYKRLLGQLVELKALLLARAEYYRELGRNMSEKDSVAKAYHEGRAKKCPSQ